MKEFNEYELKLIAFLKALSFNNQSEIFLFGSRAKRTHSKHSDIDIAFLNLPQEIKLSELKEKIDELNIPYHVDLIDLNSSSQEFYNECLKEAINIQNV